MNRKIGVLLSYVLMIFEVLSTLLLTPFILRTLGQAEYGVYRLSGSIVAYLLLLDLGLGNSLIRFLSKFRSNGDFDSGKKFMGVSMIYYALIAIIAFIAGMVLILLYPKIFAEGLTATEIDLGQKLLFITSITASVTLATTPFSNSLIAYEKFAVQKTASIIQIIFKITITFLLLKLGYGSLGIVFVNLILTLLGRAFFVIYHFLKIKLYPTLKGIDIKFVKEIIGYSFLILLQMIATQINAGVGQILLGIFVPGATVIIAVFGIGTQVVQYFQSIGSSVTDVLMPGIVSLVESKAGPKRLCDEMIRIGRIIFMILSMIWCGFLIFGKQFIILWAGEDSADAFAVALVLMTVYLFVMTESVGLQILWAMNENREMSFLKLAIVVLNVVLTAFLIKTDPIMGATAGTALSLLIGDLVVMNILFKKKIGIGLLEYYKGLFKGIVPCIFITLICGYLFGLLNLSGWIGLVINVGFTVAVFSLSMLLIGMNKYEKGLIRNIIKRIF